MPNTQPATTPATTPAAAPDPNQMPTLPEVTKYELTDAHLKAWGDTRAALIWECPAFTHIFYTMMNKNENEHIAMFTDQVPIAATDGSHILINPETFFKHSLRERVFVIAHEILHGVFGHCETMLRLQSVGKIVYPDGKELAYDHTTMNHAADYVINDMLIQSNIGVYHENWLHDTNKGTHTDDVLVVYRRIFEEQKGQGKGAGQGSSSGSGNGSGQSSFDQHLAPGTSTGQSPQAAAQARNPVEWKTAVAGALASARAQGKMPGSLDRALSDMLEPEVDWIDRVDAFLSRRPGGGSYDWAKADRRFVTRGIIAPARSGFGCGPIVAGIDTSGSMGQREIDIVFAELAGVLEDLRPSELYVMWCDTKVHRVDVLEEVSDLLDLKEKGAPGGGGTLFAPVFDMVKEMEIEPDALIYLTDGYAPFPDEPDYPVLWGAIDVSVKFPWGDVVEIPIR